MSGRNLNKRPLINFNKIMIRLLLLANVCIVISPPSVWAEMIKKHNPVNNISVETLKYKLDTDKKLMIIDVRNSAAYEEVRIPGSVNIPLYALKTKNYLKTKNMVLANEGFSRTQIEKECESLIKLGFNIKILNGGLTAWQKNGNSLDGDQFKAKKINMIKPVELFLEKDFKNTFLIDISKKSSVFLKNIANSKHITANNKKSGNIKTIEKYIKSQKTEITLSVVITNENGKNYQLIKKQLTNSGDFNLFFLEGGRIGYRTFLEKNNRMHVKKGKRLVKQAGCATCGEKE